MAQSPPDYAVQRELKRAQKFAEDHNKKYSGRNAQARVIRASNGEMAIVYDYTDKRGNRQTIASLKAIQ